MSNSRDLNRMTYKEAYQLQLVVYVIIKFQPCALFVDSMSVTSRIPLALDSDNVVQANFTRLTWRISSPTPSTSTTLAPQVPVRPPV